MYYGSQAGLMPRAGLTRPFDWFNLRIDLILLNIDLISLNIDLISLNIDLIPLRIDLRIDLPHASSHSPSDARMCLVSSNNPMR